MTGSRAPDGLRRGTSIPRLAARLRVSFGYCHQRCSCTDMANSVVPISQGLDYQARIFWLEALRLLGDRSPVRAVGYEIADIKGFDDVVVYYGENGAGSDAPDVLADHFQVKFHVADDDVFTAQALTEPAFIHAESRSLLQRLRDAQQRHADAKGRRFIMISPWTVQPRDPLAFVLGNASGEILTRRLMGNGKGMLALRKMWRTHLELDSDDDLCEVLRPLRIRTDFPTLQGVKERLSAHLVAAGLKPYPDGALATGYDELPMKLVQHGQACLDRSGLERLAEREGLWAARTVSVTPDRPRARQVGVRSFARWAEHMGDETETMIALEHHFDGRSIRDPELWTGEVLPALHDFLKREVRDCGELDLHLDAHATIAFTAGWELDPKCGVAVHPMQRGASGKTTWNALRGPACHDTRVWAPEVEIVDAGRHDVAVVLAVARHAEREAVPFIKDYVPTVGRILTLRPCMGVGATAVRDAAHARRLSEDAAALVAEQQQLAAMASGSRASDVHVFIAAPNGLTFFLGHQAHVWGAAILYEYDFGRTEAVAYARSVRLTDR